MPYDEDLARRVRQQTAEHAGVTEKEMFGGLAFMLHGNMAVCASSRGGLMVRVGAEAADGAVAQPHVQPFLMRGRPMAGWVEVDREGLRTARQLAAWVDRGVAFARTLPSKG